MTSGWRARSSYLALLPEVLAFHASGEDGGGPPPGEALDLLLYACEAVLTGHGRPDRPGLEELLDGIAGEQGGWVLAGSWRYHDPGLRSRPDRAVPAQERVPDADLVWLAGWVAATVRDDVESGVRRAVVAQAVPLHRWRGTLSGLQQALDLHLRGARVEEPEGWFRVGESRLGVDTYLDGPVPHFFTVRLAVPPEQLRPGGTSATLRLAREIVEEHKPAHTVFAFEITSEFMQLSERSTVGVDTLIGGA